MRHAGRGGIAGVVLAALAGTAAAQEPPKLTDQLIEQLAAGLARAADAGSPRAVAYFTTEPTAQVRAYLEGQGVEVVVTPGGPPAGVTLPPPGAAPAAPPGPAPAAMLQAATWPGGHYGMVGMRVPESKKLIQDFLTGVRDLHASLPPGSPLAVEAFTVDLPGGSILFRLR
jgi:hypothetical protein